MKNDPLIEILKKELIRKKSRNASYSLRSYSRDLEIDPSNLSKLLAYQKSIGPRLRIKIGKKLGFTNEAIESWLRPAAQANTNDQVYINHNLDLFKVISEWQYYALLEYFKINNASSNPVDIAKHLNLEVTLINSSLDRLLELGLLVKKGKKISPSEESSSSILDVPTSPAHREQQVQILEGAIDALKNTPIELRSQSSMTLAIDSKKLDEARELIKNFRRDIGRLLSSSNQLDNVYQLSVSLYPVTKTLKKEKLK